MKKLFGLFLTFVLGLVVTGCGTNYYKYEGYRTEVPSRPDSYREFPIYLDKSFTDGEEGKFEQVIQEWNYVLNHQMLVTLEKDKFSHDDVDTIEALLEKHATLQEGFIVIGVNTLDDELGERLDNGALAFVNNLGRKAQFMVVFRDRLFGEKDHGHKDARKVLLHEFGHALGANHVNTDSLMFPYYGSGHQLDCVDKITAAQVATYWNLKLEKLNFCPTPNFK